MEGFRPEVALFLITMVSFILGLVFFLNATMINIISKKPWDRRSLSPTLWGFAFMALGWLGNHFLQRALQVAAE